MLLADRGYDADWIRAIVTKRRAWANIPPRSNRNEPICFSPHLYRARNPVERFFNRIKQCRRIATRYDKLAANYLAFIQARQEKRERFCVVLPRRRPARQRALNGGYDDPRLVVTVTNEMGQIVLSIPFSSCLRLSLALCWRHLFMRRRLGRRKGTAAPSWLVLAPERGPPGLRTNYQRLAPSECPARLVLPLRPVATFSRPPVVLR
jgi:hypothetical protein